MRTGATSQRWDYCTPKNKKNLKKYILTIKIFIEGSTISVCLPEGWAGKIYKFHSGTHGKVSILEKKKDENKE